MVEETPKTEEQAKKNEVDTDRRNFLKATVVASAALAVGGMAAIAKVADETGAIETSQTTQSAFPRVLIQDLQTKQTANVNTMTNNDFLTFNYPLDNEPNIIVKLGVKVDDGVGPDQDIVAYSVICQHLGCNPGYVYPGGPGPFCKPSYSTGKPVLYCCCHGSIYDLTNNANVIGGPAPRPVPRVVLEVDSNGDIYATNMGPPTIYEHGPAGSDDVTYDLQGGTPVA